ncbi:hypothetical protein EW146_g320 [Bondarzewia mesenterica]|uniref:DUF6570 domain-containing protein n=1 Tax=Bondarzewia mesenterica TaxID=1095465 RepID=A0A4S4M7E6_9AGAM|nr:hypothetical protein EW146_g320 [Bondarzewia mesenterica]
MASSSSAIASSSDITINSTFDQQQWTRFSPVAEPSSFTDNLVSSREKEIWSASLDNIRRAAKGKVVLSRQERATKADMIRAILQRCDDDFFSDLRVLVQGGHDEVQGRSSAEIEILSRDEILKEISGVFLVSADERASKTAIVAALSRRASEEIFQRLRLVADGKRRKRVATNEVDGSRKRLRTLEGDNGDCFMTVPSVDERDGCYRDFYDATGNRALAKSVCAVCARECNNQEEGVVELPLEVVPNGERLRPKDDVYHPSHVLIDGMLLEEKGLVKVGETVLAVKICGSCMSALNTECVETPPKYSLANNLWIGTVPWELTVLTVPEQLLIALLYPRVYVFKLTPKGNYNRGDASTLQRGMRGTVSTYEQDFEGVARMTDGKLMPRSPSLLALIMSVTFIGQGPLPKNWLQRTFKVRRSAVKAALQWLKKNNAKYYGDIEISDSRLAALPEDDVPHEVLMNIKQSGDVGMLLQESDGYVPREDVEPEFGQ